MNGLCHLCFSTNEVLTSTKGVIHCQNCIPEPKKEVKVSKIEEGKDLEKSRFVYKICQEMYDKQFEQFLEEERRFDKRY